VTIPVKKSQEARYNLDPESFFVHRSWGRRPDGVAINEVLQIVYIFQFKRSTDRDEGFLEVKEAEANEQHTSIIGALKAAAPEWDFDQIIFVVLYLHIFTCTYRGTYTQANMYNQHTRGMATTRHRSVVERGGGKAFVRDKDLAHTKKKEGKKTSEKNWYSRIWRKRFEHTGLPAKLLDYFLRSNKSNINQSLAHPLCLFLSGLGMEAEQNREGKKELLVPNLKKIPARATYLITTHHSYAFLTAWGG